VNTTDIPVTEARLLAILQSRLTAEYLTDTLESCNQDHEYAARCMAEWLAQEIAHGLEQ
jgi:hypothetical protein